MAEIILFSQSKESEQVFRDLLPQERHTLYVTDSAEDCMKKLYAQNIDGVIIDYECNEDLSGLARKIKVVGKQKLPFVMLYAPIDYENELLFRYIDGFLSKGSTRSQLNTLLYSAMRIEKNVTELSKNNSELAKNIYQLDVLYNTSSSFASTLNKKKLIDLMIQSIQRSISPTFISVYIKETNTLYLSSNRKPTYRLEEALKVRSALNFKNVYQNENINFEDIKIEKKFTEEFSDIDLQLFNYDNVFSLIMLSDKNYGFIEIFKEADFSQEDFTCLQTILKQVSSPLENAILYQEIKDTNTKLEKLERLKSDFISIVSHELRTPLTPIKNSLDIILRGSTGKVSEQTIKFVDMAKRNADRLSDIINDLLDLSKVEAGKMDFRFEKKSILPAIEYVANTFENTAKNKNINLVYSEAKNIPDLYIDSKRIEQIISNLVSNAIKFTSDNGSVKITCEKIDAKKIIDKDFYEQTFNDEYDEYVKISVKDTGIGIKKEDICKIFDKFQQIESSIRRDVGGTGLGLPIAKQLTQAHQGVIWLESEPDRGSCFSIAIPILDDFQIFKAELKQALNSSKQFKKPLSLLLIKDNKKTLINAIKNEQISISQNASVFHYVDFCHENNNYYICFLKDIDENVLDFMVKKIQSYVKSNLEEDGIMFAKAVYPKDGLTREILLDKLRNELKNIRE